MGGDASSGILLIDKPADMSSAAVVARVKKVLRAKKAGHAGTLDPFATGVLVCCINNATRLARFFLSGDKKYRAVLQLGVETETQDATGKVVSRSRETDFDEKTIAEVFKRFEGTIKQRPPAYSALKHKGVPLYRYARKGKKIQKPARQVKILNLSICKIELPLIHFEVACSAGTYIRTLCSDIGNDLGCGGILKELRRVESHGFRIEDAISLEELEFLDSSGTIKDRVISMADSLKDMPAVTVDDGTANKLRHGVILTKQELSIESGAGAKGFVRVVDTNQDLIAVISEDLEKNRLKYCCVFS